jgi:hypothetical protein
MVRATDWEDYMTCAMRRARVFGPVLASCTVYIRSSSSECLFLSPVPVVLGRGYVMML